jgi:hypothetical protein
MFPYFGDIRKSYNSFNCLSWVCLNYNSNAAMELKKTFQTVLGLANEILMIANPVILIEVF